MMREEQKKDMRPLRPRRTHFIVTVLGDSLSSQNKDTYCAEFFFKELSSYDRHFCINNPKIQPFYEGEGLNFRVTYEGSIKG